MHRPCKRNTDIVRISSHNYHGFSCPKIVDCFHYNCTKVPSAFAQIYRWILLVCKRVIAIARVTLQQGSSVLSISVPKLPFLAYNVCLNQSSMHKTLRSHMFAQLLSQRQWIITRVTTYSAFGNSCPLQTDTYPLETSFNSVMKDWADKYHVWGTPTRSPSRSNSR